MSVQFSHIKTFERLIHHCGEGTNSHDEHFSVLCCELLTELSKFRTAAYWCPAAFWTPKALRTLTVTLFHSPGAASAHETLNILLMVCQKISPSSFFPSSTQKTRFLLGPLKGEEICWVLLGVIFFSFLWPVFNLHNVVEGWNSRIRRQKKEGIASSITFDHQENLKFFTRFIHCNEK